MARRIPWDYEELVEFASECASVGDLAALVSERWDVHVSSSTLSNHLGRHRDVKSRVFAAFTAEGEGVISRADILEEENRELRLALNRQRRESVGAERVIQAIELALADLKPPSRKSFAPVKSEPGKPHHRQMILLSDFHGGEVVDPDVVQGLNEYDWQIMEDRVQEVIASLLKHRDRSPDLTGLDIVFLGDMCSGSNHDELAVTNEYPLAEQGVRMGLLMGRIVEQLAPHYPNMRVVTVEGNHPRLNKAPQAKNPQDNMDWVAAQFARQYLKDVPNVEFTVGRASVVHRIAGLNVYCWHGDGIRSSMPGVPWGGVMRRVNQLQATLPQHIDHWCFGHFHTANIVGAGRVIGNGALKGADEYCFKTMGVGDPPAQWLLTFDEKRSRLTDARLVTPTAGVPT